MQGTRSYLPKVFMDDSDNPKIKEFRQKMRHSLDAADVNRLKTLVAEVENDNELTDAMK